jgi:hypothetical protein
MATVGEVKVPVVLAQDPAGGVHELYERALVVEAARVNCPGVLAETRLRGSAGRDGEDGEAVKRREALAVVRRGHELVMDEVVRVVGEDDAAWERVLPLLAAEAVGRVDGYVGDGMVRRRAMEVKVGEVRKQLGELVAAAVAAGDVGMWRGLMVEALTAEAYFEHGGKEFSAELVEVAAAVGVDAAGCLERARAERDAARLASEGERERAFLAWVAERDPALVTRKRWPKGRREELLAEYAAWEEELRGKAAGEALVGRRKGKGSGNASAEG